jgi:hypothetical protein
MSSKARAAPRLKSKVTVRLVRASRKPNVLRSPVGTAMTALAVMNATPGGQPIAIAKDVPCSEMAAASESMIKLLKSRLTKAVRENLVSQGDMNLYMAYRKSGLEDHRRRCKQSTHEAFNTVNAKAKKEYRRKKTKEDAAKKKAEQEAQEAKAQKRARLEVETAHLITDTKRARAPANKKTVRAHGVTQVVFGEDDRQRWSWERLPDGMKTEIEARLDRELDGAGGMSEGDLLLIAEANTKFDLILKHKGIDPETGINMLELYLETDWRKDKGSYAKGQDCCHIFAQ